MTPKEKAIELLDKFMLRIILNIKQNITVSIIESAKQCALLSVDEILNSLDSKKIIYGSDYRFEENTYWEQVKKEIENL